MIQRRFFLTICNDHMTNMDIICPFESWDNTQCVEYRANAMCYVHKYTHTDVTYEIEKSHRMDCTIFNLDKVGVHVRFNVCLWLLPPPPLPANDNFVCLCVPVCVTSHIPAIQCEPGSFQMIIARYIKLNETVDRRSVTFTHTNTERRQTNNVYSVLCLLCMASHHNDRPKHTQCRFCNDFFFRVFFSVVANAFPCSF